MITSAKAQTKLSSCSPPPRIRGSSCATTPHFGTKLPRVRGHVSRSGGTQDGTCCGPIFEGTSWREKGGGHAISVAARTSQFAGGYLRKDTFTGGAPASSMEPARRRVRCSARFFIDGRPALRAAKLADLSLLHSTEEANLAAVTGDDYTKRRLYLEWPPPRWHTGAVMCFAGEV